MKQPSAMKHSFSNVANIDIPRSVFDRSRPYKTTFDSGYLIPFFTDEILPGDSMNLSQSLFARLATPIKPIMDNMYLETFYFFVPNRINWNNWEKFCGAQDDPGDSVDFLVPEVAITGGVVVAGGISDYFGLPVGVDMTDANPACFHYRSYNRIWNEFFRDENLQDGVDNNRSQQADIEADYVLLRRGKRHDYFTSALPFPQKGDSVSIGLAGNIEVMGDGNTLGFDDGTDEIGIYKEATSGSGRGTAVSTTLFDVALGTDVGTPSGGTTDKGMGVTTDGTKSGLVGDLSTATSITINDLREAFQTQKFLEKQARGGTRYTELLRTHFGVTSPDSRFQRPEYLGGSSTRININPVQQTGESDTTPQGNLAAFGVAADKGGIFNKSFTEHGVIMGFVNVRADLTYQQGINRMWTRSSIFDFYWPSFAHLGEQAVLNKEIYTAGTADNLDNAVFGYQERHAEYRFGPALITGLFRSSHVASLDVWHLSQDFAARPLLNAAFIIDEPPIPRVIAVPTEPEFLLDAYFTVKHARAMPTYSTPGFVDHF